jgi:hypothetical protein
MDFQLNKKLKASLVLFVAFDGSEVQQVQMKVRLPVYAHYHAIANLFTTDERSKCDALHEPDEEDTKGAPGYLRRGPIITLTHLPVCDRIHDNGSNEHTFHSLGVFPSKEPP